MMGRVGDGESGRWGEWEMGRRGDEEMGVFQYCLVILLGISYVVSSFRFQVTFL